MYDEVASPGRILLIILNSSFSFIPTISRSHSIKVNSDIFIIMESNEQQPSEFYGVVKSKPLATFPCFLIMKWYYQLWRGQFTEACYGSPYQVLISPSGNLMAWHLGPLAETYSSSSHDNENPKPWEIKELKIKSFGFLPPVSSHWSWC